MPPPPKPATSPAANTLPSGEPSAASTRADDLGPAAAGEVGILLGAGQRELALDDLLAEHEPGVLVARRHDVGERAQRVEAREQRNGEPLAARVEPYGRRAGEDADAVPRPDRAPVLDALRVVPHAVAVDDVTAGGLRDPKHAPVDVIGHPADHGARRCAQPRGPGLAHQIEIAADAA